jgi:hypothetical protein
MVEAKLDPAQVLRLGGWSQAGREPIAGVCRARVPVGDIDAMCRDEMRGHTATLRMVSGDSTEEVGPPPTVIDLPIKTHGARGCRARCG